MQTNLKNEESGIQGTEQKPEPKIITPLRHLLSQIPLADLFAFMQRWGVSYTLHQQESQQHQVSLRVAGGLGALGYGKSPQAALADALATYLTAEQRDIHEVRGTVERLGH